MGVQELLQSLNDRVAASANARSVYGEPVETRDRTIIPVARVQYGFGGGVGHEEEKEGSGGGGCVRAKPVGVVEVDDQGTRFVPIIDATSLAAAVGLGLVVGLLMRR